MSLNVSYDDDDDDDDEVIGCNHDGELLFGA